MRLSEIEFWLCASYLGYTEIPGMETKETDKLKIDREKVRRNLAEQEVMELGNETYAFTPLGQYVFHTVGKADAYIRIEGKKGKRRLYVKDENYICIDQNEEQLEIYLLPSFPLVIGAYADALEEPEVELEGKAGQEEMKLQIASPEEGKIVYQKWGVLEVYKEYEKADCVNDITSWLLSSLGSKRESING